MAGGGIKARLKHIAARIMRPGLAALDGRVGELGRRIDHLTSLTESLAAPEAECIKQREELAFWRWLIKTDEGRASLHAPFDTVFGTWQRDRLRELAQGLDLAPSDAGPGLDQALDAWCACQSVVEIGAGPYPAVAAAPQWRRAVAVDPLAKGYAQEGLLPPTAAHITYIEAPGESVPLPSGFADLVIIENALDHVSSPEGVLSEIVRLLRPGGVLWVLVDLSTYSDHMHPHPFDERRIRTLLNNAGLEVVTDRISDHKSHPKAYGEYRGLLRKPDPSATRAPSLPSTSEALAD